MSTKWVLISSGDGYHTKIVEGWLAMENEFLRMHFGDVYLNASNAIEADALLTQLRDDDMWERSDGNNNHFNISHEDGSVDVYRLTEN